MEIIDVLKSFGLPTLFLGCLAYAVWRACAWLAENVFKPLVQGHLAFLAKLASAIDQLDKKNDAILEIIHQRNQVFEYLTGKPGVKPYDPQHQQPAPEEKP